MPAAAPVIAIGGAIAAGVIGGGTGAAIGVVAALGAGVLAGMGSKPDSARSSGRASQTPVEDRGHQINTTSSRRPLPLIYGTCKVGCNKTYTFVDNPYLHMICELGEGEINGILRQDDSVYSTTAAALPTSNPPLVYLDDKLFSKYNSANVHIEFFTGSSTQSVCSTLSSASPEWGQTLRYTAYLYVRLKYDRDEFKNLPDVTAVVQGLKVYDPVTTTTAFTDNPALCTYDFLTRSSQRGGLGISAARINTASISDAKSYCSLKGWTGNMPVTENGAAADNLRLLMNNFRGDVIYSDNQFKLRYMDLNYEASVMALNMDDIIAENGASTLTVTQPDAQERPNAVRLTHLSEDKQYKSDDYIKPDKDAIDSEGDYREYAVKAYGLTAQDKAQGMANYHLERQRWNKRASLVAGSRAMALEPMDIVTLTHDMPGWNGKNMRVIACGLQADQRVALELIEEDIALYDDAYNLTDHHWNDTTLPDPGQTPPSVASVNTAEEVYYYRGRSFTRWKIDFAAPEDTVYPWFDYAEVWVKIGSGGDWRYMTKSENNYVLDPVEEGEYYAVKLRAVSIWGQKEDFDDAYTVETTIVGKTSGPGSLSTLSAIANGDSVSVYSTPLDEPDLEGYEVRIGAAWNGGVFLSFNKNISLRLNGMRPGTHTFWAAAKNNVGLYSGTPKSANVTVYIPPGYSELTTYGSWAWDFSTGTFDNAEQTTYDSEDALKCSHTSGALSGSWTSATYDLNSVERVRVWGDFRTAFESGDTTWAGVIPSPDTWADVDISTKTWQQIFEPTAAAQIQATLRYKELTGDSWTEVDYFEILCAEVKARYLSVVVTITDPTADSNLYLKELNMLAYTGPQE